MSHLSLYPLEFARFSVQKSEKTCTLYLWDDSCLEGTFGFGTSKSEAVKGFLFLFTETAIFTTDYQQFEK